MSGQREYAPIRPRDWLMIFALFFCGLFGTHVYDDVTAHEAAKTAAGVVYQTQLKACQDTNPVRGQQRLYFATVAKGRATSAQHEDAGNPIQRAVDNSIAVVAHDTSETYIARFGARPDGKLNCRITTVRP
jgi:hypothetical protein